MQHFPPDLRLRRAQTEAMLALGRGQAEIARRAAVLFAADPALRDITPAQSNLLMVLFNARRPMTARELHRALGQAEPTVSRFVQALEKNGWVRREKSPDDARAMLIEPSAKARDALPRFIAASNQLLDCAFAGLEPGDVETLLGLVRRMTDNLGEPG